jgi:hypothetical protein
VKDGAVGAATLTNLGVAILLAGQPYPHSAARDEPAAAAAAAVHLQAARALSAASDAAAQQRRVLLALSAAHEGMSAHQEAATAMRDLVALSLEAAATPAVAAHLKAAHRRALPTSV